MCIHRQTYSLVREFTLIDGFWIVARCTMYKYRIHTGYKYSYNMQSFEVWWWIAENYDGYHHAMPNSLPLSFSCSLCISSAAASFGAYTEFIWIRETFFISMISHAWSILIAHLHKLSLNVAQRLVHVYVCMCGKFRKYGMKCETKLTWYGFNFENFWMGVTSSPQFCLGDDGFDPHWMHRVGAT